mgnify:CR=1 FL=1
MSDFSTNLQLPYLMPAQAQKHVTVNESLRRMDALVQMRVQSRATTAQPGSPADGELWILPDGKSGADWDGFTAGRIAYYRDGAWEEVTPRAGWFAFVMDEALLCVFGGVDWTSALAASDALLAGDLADAAAVSELDQQVKAGSTPAFAGVQFPATQAPSADPNTLDDYEEGGWTPSISFGGGAVGLTYGANNGGRYRKIGGFVFASGYLEVTGKGSSTGGAALGGLPFPVAGAGLGAHAAGAIAQIPGVTASAGLPSLLIAPGGSTAVFGETGSAAQLTHAAFPASFSCLFSLMYGAA